ncbi:unnamed protein product [Rangifer tarandus platyrhynchus]|uniref:Uncharacterized protein n=1 Tax=Rangifer tarandus platyrhynchus TaxID=3082113 RepID=A0AC59Y1Q0_RANTA
MAGPGAPSRPPPAELTGWPAAAPALRRGPLPVTSPPWDAPGSAPLPQRRAVGAPRSRPPSPDPRGRRAAVRGAGDAAIRTQGAAWGQRAPRARARRRRRGSGRVRAAGAGRTCVCLCRSRMGGRALLILLSPFPLLHVYGWMRDRYKEGLLCWTLASDVGVCNLKRSPQIRCFLDQNNRLLIHNKKRALAG